MIDKNNENELYKLHKKMVKEQGRTPKWLYTQLDCSYSLVYQYLNGLKPMSRTKVEKLHSLLTK